MTLAFAAAMAVVLFVVGLLIYVRYESELDSSIDRGLRSRAGDVATLLRETDSGGDALPSRAESLGEDSFAQVLTPSGRVLDTTGQTTPHPVLDTSDLAAGTGGPDLRRGQQRSGPRPGAGAAARDLRPRPRRAADRHRRNLARRPR